MDGAATGFALSAEASNKLTGNDGELAWMRRRCNSISQTFTSLAEIPILPGGVEHGLRTASQTATGPMREFQIVDEPVTFVCF